MSVAYGPMATALTGDVLMEHLLSSSAVTLSGGLLQFPFSTSHADCRVYLGLSVGAVADNVIGFVQGKIAVSGSPTREIGIVCDSGDGSVGHAQHRFLRIGTDKKLKFYDGNDTLIASSTTAVSTNSASPTEFFAYWDMLTLPTVWVGLYVNGTEEVAHDSQETPGEFITPDCGTVNYFGEALPSATNCGATVTAQYIVGGADNAEGPSVRQFGRLLALGAYAPTAEGNYHAWANGTTASPNTYQDVDDAGTNDGDTSRIADIQQTDPKTAHSHLFKHATANPFGGTETIVFVQAKHIGRANAVGKDYGKPLIRLASVDLALTPIGPAGSSASYAGGAGVTKVTPSSTAWATTDADLSGGTSKLEFGMVSTVAASIDTAAYVTKMVSPEFVYYTALLPLATTPTQAGAAVTTAQGGIF